MWHRWMRRKRNSEVSDRNRRDQLRASEGNPLGKTLDEIVALDGECRALSAFRRAKRGTDVKIDGLKRERARVGATSEEGDDSRLLKAEEATD